MKNIELLAGENSNRTTSENEASSAGIGVSFSPQGLSGLSLSASKAQGNSKENASTYTPTEIAAKDALQIESGKDTNILGSTVQGDKVTAKIGGNLNIETLQEKETYEEKNKVYNTIGLSPSLSMPAKGDANSTTTSAVAPGTIDIRENPTQDISALSRDTANSLNELGRIFDKETIAEQQELAAAFGEEAFRLAHNLPDEGSGRKIAIHAIIGGIMSQTTGSGFSSGAIGAGINEAVIGEIKKIKDPGTAQIVSAIVGAAAAKATGGNAGAGATAAASGTKNNSLITQFDFIRDGIHNNNWVYELPEGHCVYSLYSVRPTTIMTIIFNVDGMPVFPRML